MLPLLLLLILTPTPATSELVLEEGYTVSTVLDFHKEKDPAVHLDSILPRSRSRGILLLDSLASAFYSIPLPLSQESEISLFSGKGVPGFADGDPTAAMFNKPKSFAIDSRDNVYVADQSNFAIRKISRDGVTTTIAGGSSDKIGRVDGPALNATFSNKFELVYVPNMCVLLISDVGNQLIRQMKLKAEDCANETSSGLGAAPVSLIAVLCVFIGSILGFITRPFLTRYEIFSNHCFSRTWKHYQANLRKLMQIVYSVIKSAAAKSTPCTIVVKLVVLSLNYLSVVFRNVRPEKRVRHREPVWFREPVSLLDTDATSNLCVTNSQVFADQLSDLICFGEGVVEMDLSGSSTKMEDEAVDASKGSTGKLDDLITTNLLDFTGIATHNDQMEGSTSSSSVLVKRRAKRDDGL